MQRNHNTREDFLKLGLGLLLAAGCAIQPAHSDDITFRILFDHSVKLPSDLQMNAWIKVKSSGHDYERRISFRVPTPGKRETTQFDCTKSSLFFTAEVTNILYELDALDAEKECQQGEISFLFHEKKYSKYLAKAIEGYSLNEIKSAPFSTYQANLTDAMKNNNVAAALINSSQLYGSLSGAGYKKIAEPYRALNLDLAKKVLVSTGFLEPGAGGLFYNLSQKKYVLDDDSVNSIKQFQSNKKLIANGKVDWKTMNLLGSITK